MFFLWFSFDHSFFYHFNKLINKCWTRKEKKICRKEKKKRNETTLKYRVDITTARLDCEWCRFEWRIFSKPKNCDCLVFVAFSLFHSFVRCFSHTVCTDICVYVRVCIRTNTRSSVGFQWFSCTCAASVRAYPLPRSNIVSSVCFVRSGVNLKKMRSISFSVVPFLFS